jgi:hypothetical protein
MIRQPVSHVPQLQVSGQRLALDSAAISRRRMKAESSAGRHCHWDMTFTGVRYRLVRTAVTITVGVRCGATNNGPLHLHRHAPAFHPQNSLSVAIFSRYYMARTHTYHLWTSGTTRCQTSIILVAASPLITVLITSRFKHCTVPARYL